MIRKRRVWAAVAGEAALGSNIGALIAGLTADGVLPLLDRLWVFAQATSALARVDLIAGASASPVNSPTFTANRGYQGDGISSYVDTNFNTLSSGTNFTQNSAHLSIWQNVAPTTGTGTHGTVNTDAGTNGAYVDFQTGVNGATTRINDATVAVNTVVGGVGHLIGNRTGSTALALWYNGSKGANQAAASQAVQNLTAWIGARNFAGSYNAGSDATVMAVSLGGGLSDAQALALYNRLLTYKTAIGA